MRTISNTATPDVISELLDAVRVRTTIYCRSDMRAPWGFGVRAHGNPSFHIVTKGDAWLEIDSSGGAIELHAGDLVLLPHGPTPWLGDRPETPPPRPPANPAPPPPGGKRMRRQR